jgi:hypothetical protein
MIVKRTEKEPKKLQLERAFACEKEKRVKLPAILTAKLTAMLAAQ